MCCEYSCEYSSCRLLGVGLIEEHSGSPDVILYYYGCPSDNKKRNTCVIRSGELINPTVVIVDVSVNRYTTSVSNFLIFGIIRTGTYITSKYYYFPDSVCDDIVKP